jgi:hypothetical protein
MRVWGPAGKARQEEEEAVGEEGHGWRCQVEGWVPVMPREEAGGVPTARLRLTRVCTTVVVRASYVMCVEPRPGSEL